MLNTQGPLLNGENKIPVFLSYRQGMDSVKDLLTFVLSAETDLATGLPRQISPKFPKMTIPDCFFPSTLPHIRGGVACTLWHADL